MLNEKLYYCVNGKLGISRFNDDDSMLGLCCTEDKSLWIKFTESEAKEVERIIDYHPIPTD